MATLRQFYYLWGHRTFAPRVFKALIVSAIDKKKKYFDHKADILRRDLILNRDAVYKKFWEMLRDAMNPEGEIQKRIWREEQ